MTWMSVGTASAIAFVALSGCLNDGDLVTICPPTCYTGRAGTAGHGECARGVPVCDQDGNVLSCEGEVTPQREVCNAVDDDCDDEVDEVLSLSPYSQDNSCAQCGKCRGTREICDPFTGQWYCAWSNGPPAASDTTCDGIDEDCDCSVDEDVYASGELVFCYDGPPETVQNDPCRPGLEVCFRGQTACVGQHVPSDETCNMIDDDCNGWTDDVTTFYSGIDMIFAIDVSGSMGQYNQAVAESVCNYAAATEQRPDLVVRMGLVLIASPDRSYSLRYNLTDAATLCTILGDIPSSGGTEPTLSAAEAVADPANPLAINWTDGSKRIFIGFGDEEAQAVCFEAPCDSLDEVVVNTLAYCEESNTSIYWFLGSDTQFYEDQAFGCGGDLFWLTGFAPYMQDSLSSIIEEVCLEDVP